jgi:hypothetical protein
MPKVKSIGKCYIFVLYIATIMETIRLEFQPNIKAKILELLSSFSLNELKIVQEDEEFSRNKAMIKEEVEKIENGTAEYCTFEELDSYLDEVISEYDN